MKNRVMYQEEISKSIDRIPFLKRFLNNNYSIMCPFSIDKINKYMGYEFYSKQSHFTSASINIILEYAEKRGDLKNIEA